MPGKLRVHELAKQLGVTSKELLATLKDQGEFVKTASSTIEPPVVKKMRAYYEAQDGDGAAKKDGEAKASAKPAGAAKPGAPRPAAGARGGEPAGTHLEGALTVGGAAAQRRVEQGPHVQVGEKRG